jgi:hypothetical protein
MLAASRIRGMDVLVHVVVQLEDLSITHEFLSKTGLTLGGRNPLQLWRRK